MALGLVAIFSFELVDLVFISQLGDAPLAAVSFTFPVIWLLMGIGIGFEAGTASCVSRAVGRGDHKLAKRITTDTVVLASAVFLVLCLIGLATIRPVFTLLGATEELMPLIEDYMEVRYWVDPVEELVVVYLTQLIPAGGLDDHGRLRALIYQAIED